MFPFFSELAYFKKVSRLESSLVVLAVYAWLAEQKEG